MDKHLKICHRNSYQDIVCSVESLKHPSCESDLLF